MAPNLASSKDVMVSRLKEVTQQEKQRSDRLAAKLRELNIHPDAMDLQEKPILAVP